MTWFGFDPFQSLRSNWARAYDVTRTDNGYEVEVPVPGFKPEGSRSFTVPEDVGPDKIEAKVRVGMLVLTLAGGPEAQPRRINVN